MMHHSEIYVCRKKHVDDYPISMPIIKSFLNIENDQDDDLLNTLIAGAVEYAEWYMERSIVLQTWQISYLHYMPQKIYIPFSPVINVESIQILTADGTISVLESDQYFLDTVCSCVIIKRKISGYRLDIIYQAGYPANDLVPAQIKQGIMRIVQLLIQMWSLSLKFFFLVKFNIIALNRL